MLDVRTGKMIDNPQIFVHDGRIVSVKQGKNINMDGRKVGGTLQQVATNT